MGNIGTKLYDESIKNNLFLKPNQSIHLAIVNQPFLNYILNGEKRIESRFSINKCSPYKKVKENDIVFIKDSGKSIIAYFIVKKVEYYINNNENIINHIKSNYANDICAFNDEFWEERHKKKYISLIWIKGLTLITPFNVEKKISVHG